MIKCGHEIIVKMIEKSVHVLSKTKLKARVKSKINPHPLSSIRLSNHNNINKQIGKEETPL